MTEQDRYIPGVPCWIDTAQPDPEAGKDFYGALFGWELEDVAGPDSPGPYFVGRLTGGDVAAVGPAGEGASQAASWNTYIWVDDADETAAKVREAGGAVVGEPEDVGELGRMATFADPDGARFSVWQPGSHRGAAVVNEHGSLVFNDLKTHDLETAAAFYGAVFGWEVLDVGGAPMWAMPAYGEFLERRTPGTRENMAAMGAPERFEEVVASVTAVPASEPARWDVTFAVDDADAIAARAAELGGRVIAEPIDAPWVRFALLADPQGATFAASAFVPENKGLAAPS